MTEARAISDGVDLKALIERVREAKGPDREIDLALFKLDNGYARVEFDYHDSAGPRAYAWRGPNDADYAGEIDAEFTRYTASIDAALGLVERLLPGFSWGVDRTDEGDGEPWFDATVGGSGFAQHQTAPLAILLALLTSLSEDTTHAK